MVRWIACGVVAVASTASEGAAQAYLGSSPLPAGLNASDVVLFEDFETHPTLFDMIGDPDTTSSVSMESFYGGQWALRMDGADSGKFSELMDLGEGFDELYARYMFRVGDPTNACWSSNQHYKNMGFEGGGTGDCNGGTYTSDGTDCFTVRSRFNYPALGVKVESAPFPGDFNDVNTTINAADGEWHCLEIYVRLNDPDVANGEIHYWVDEQESVVSDLRFRTVSTLTIDNWWWTYWSNDDWCGPLYTDDLVVSRAPIGCPGSPPPPPPPPPPAGDGGRDDGGAVGDDRPSPTGDASGVDSAYNPASTASSSGCACQLGGGATSPPWVLGCVLLTGLLATLRGLGRCSRRASNRFPRCLRSDHPHRWKIRPNAGSVARQKPIA